MALLGLERARDLDEAAAAIRRRRHARAERDDRRCRRAASAGCCRAGCRGARASTRCGRRPGTARAPAGTAGFRARNRRACSIRRRATPGARTRASSAARPLRGSATATTRPPRARGRSATGSQRSSARRPPTCWPSSSTIAPTTRRAGSRSCCARSSARATSRGRAARRRLERARGDRRRGLSPGAGFRAQGRRRAPSRMIAAPAIARWPGYRLARAGAVHGGRLAHSSVRGRRTCSIRASRTGMRGSPTSRAPFRCRTARRIARASRTAAGARSTPRESGTRSAKRCRHSAGFLDMPAEPLPGDWSVPRVQSPGFGASEALRRLARARGRGLFPHAGRAERASAVAVLSRGTRGLGAGASVSVPAGTGRARPARSLPPGA